MLRVEGFRASQKKGSRPFSPEIFGVSCFGFGVLIAEY